MNPGTVLHDFELTNVTPVPEMDAELHLFRHRGTGAELLWIRRPDRNKTFSVTFKTLPENDTGVFHIMEHSVLCGSAKYPVKEPFVELMKGSMNTFLNAFTFPDKTMYPVSSRNDADFRNLVSVYLDAVFCPAVYERKNIFLQEGWRLEQDAPGEKPHYVGVVFNEMKGALSSVDEVMAYAMARMLFPDSCYRFVSGGDPTHIPELTYEAFLDAHRRFYHPSNARFFLDGDVDIEQLLAQINDDYLCRYERREPDFELKLQKPVPGQQRTISYELAPGEAPEGKAYFAMSRIIGTWEDRVRLMAAKVLCDYLAGSNDAPLKRAVLEQGLAQELRLSAEDGGMAQVTVDLMLQNMQAEKLPEARRAVQAIIRELLEKGLDRTELTGCLNRYEFKTREHNEPYGVMLSIQVMNSWLYGGDPALYLRNNEAFAALRAHLEDGYYEQLLREMFLEDDTLCELHALPSQTLGAERAAEELRSAHARWDAMTEAEQASCGAELEALHTWQQTPDSPEALATLPHLKLSEVSAEPLWVELAEQRLQGVRVLRSPVNAGGMVYLKLYFDLGDLTEEELPTAQLLARVLAVLPTARHTSQELQREIKLHLGSLTHGVETFATPGETDRCKACFVVSCSVLESKVDEAVRLIQEVQLETDLHQPERIREVMQQAFIAMQQQLVMNGMMFAVNHALSGWNATTLVADRTQGYGAYTALRALLEHFDERIEDEIAAMERLCHRISATSRLTLGVTGGVSDAQLTALLSAFPAGEPTGPLQVKLTGREDTAVTIPAAISFATLGANLNTLGFRVTGTNWVMGQLISLAYLWNEVRVQGGAYGCGLLTRESGNVCFYSYRDPSAARTLDVYRRSAAFVRSFCESGSALDTIIIGTLSELMPLLAPRFQSEQAFSRCFTGVTLEQLRQQFREVLETTPAQLLEASAQLDEIAAKGSMCVVGSAEILSGCEGLTALA